MPEKQKILIFIDWFYPAYKAGGPIKSTYNLAKTLASKWDTFIVTSNKDVDGEVLNIIVGKWVKDEGVSVIYLANDEQNRGVYSSIYRDIMPSIIYYNSLFSKNFTLIPYLLFKKYNLNQIIAPRGMLGKASLSIKPLKKKLFLFIGKHLIFSYNQTFWHATSEQEKDDIKKHLGNKRNVKLAKNLSFPTDKPTRKKIQKNKGELKLVYISRIHSIKNLLFLLQLIQFNDNKNLVVLDIFGPIEDYKYWAVCEEIVSQFDSINYKGIVPPQEVPSLIRQYHFFILPSLHENFGHSIVESISSGVPIIISDNTPWRNLIYYNVGADIALNDKESWLSYLNWAIELTQDEYNKLIENCFKYSEKYIVNNDNIKSSLKLFEIGS